MIRTTDSIYIDAPVEKVFDFYKDPRNMTEIEPSWLHTEYTDMVLTPELTGTTFSYVGKMPGVPDMAGTCEYIEAIPNRRLVWRMTGRMGEAPETETFLFEPVGSGMVLTVVDERDEFRIERIPLVGKVAEWVVDRLGVQWMHLLKAKMEGRA
jgi:uncharacterized protein YndB with AHSA1/START domain